VSAHRATPLLALALLAGCDDAGVPFTRGAREPVQVEGGQFHAGDLPADTGGPKVTTLNSQANLLFAGQAGKKITGDAEKGATAIAVRLHDVGAGYWTVPVGTPDPQTMGDLTWEADCDFAWDLKPGMYYLDFAAVNEAGAFGPVNNLPLLVQSAVPEGKVVISLQWDSAADLDLHLVTPSGNELDPKHPVTEPPDGGAGDMPPPNVGVLDRDSNASCTQDGFREEDVVFAGAPSPGTYLVRVDMFSACGAPAADFVLTVRVDGAVTQTVKGRLLDIDADGGGPGSGLFVANLSF
jgi:hypothetical protein